MHVNFCFNFQHNKKMFFVVALALCTTQVFSEDQLGRAIRVGPSGTNCWAAAGGELAVLGYAELSAAAVCCCAQRAGCWSAAVLV